MARNFEKFYQLTGTDKAERPRPSRLESLGWKPFFAQQISMEELNDTPPVRVTEIHRNGLHAVGQEIDTLVPPNAEVTVGDWLLYDQDNPGSSRILNRKSLIKRRASGSDRQVQLIAANIDTAFITTSCNKDFNIARLERYVALAFEAEVDPVIIITKPDLCEDSSRYRVEAESISDRVPVIVLDARGSDVETQLSDWCGPGQTVAFLGSSGVGKSTLVNSLSGTQTSATQEIREDDSKGRHTTTRRQLHILPMGCAVLDTPGMRELQLTDAQSGLADVFSDLWTLSTQCRFNDCQHETKPGCAVLKALDKGSIDQARLKHWKKLVAEEQYNTASLAERRSSDKAFGKMVRRIQKDNRK